MMAVEETIEGRIALASGQRRPASTERDSIELLQRRCDGHRVHADALGMTGAGISAGGMAQPTS
jgi:hypothetical protein